MHPTPKLSSASQHQKSSSIAGLFYTELLLKRSLSCQRCFWKLPLMLHGDSVPADKAVSTHPTSSTSKERGPVVHSLGCSQDPTTGLGRVRKELQSTDREKKGKLRQESLGVLASNSGRAGVQFWTSNTPILKIRAAAALVVSAVIPWSMWIV